MSRNEYGAVQQHLEPPHVRDILIPVPEDWSLLKEQIAKARSLVKLKEQLEDVSADATDSLAEIIASLVE
jgi:hypothetical protein